MTNLLVVLLLMCSSLNLIEMYVVKIILSHNPESDSYNEPDVNAVLVLDTGDKIYCSFSANTAYHLCFKTDCKIEYK